MKQFAKQEGNLCFAEYGNGGVQLLRKHLHRRDYVQKDLLRKMAHSLGYLLKSSFVIYSVNSWEPLFPISYSLKF